MPAQNRSNYRNRSENKVVNPLPRDGKGRVPPEARDLEDMVLGAIMIDSDAFGKIADILQSDSFYEPRNQLIFQSMQKLYAQELPIDMYTVVDQLTRDGNIERIGGPVAIAELTSKVGSSAHLMYHSRIVAQKALARDLITMAVNVEEKAYEGEVDVNDLLQQAESEIFQIAQNRQKRDVVPVGNVIAEAYSRMQKAAKQDGGLSGITTGYKKLDNVTLGWQRSDLIIIAARPAMGKTAFVLSMARRMAVDNNIPVAMFSLEMSNVQLVNRLISNICEIDQKKIRSGQLSQSDWQNLDTNIRLLEKAPLYLDDTPSLSISELRSKAKKLVRERGVECIIIDYLQLMNATGLNPGSREQEISMISRSLKGLAKELDIPIIALSQLNRNLEGRMGIEGKRPQLSDLRESGAIEQDADMVCFIHRPEYYHIKEDANGNSYIGMAEIIIAKHRNGAVTDVVLRFRKELAKFEDTDAVSSVSNDDGQTLPSKFNNRVQSDEASLDPANGALQPENKGMPF